MPQQLELPKYEAVWSKEYPEFLIVRCPRTDCPGTMGDRPFMVAAKEWLRPRRVPNPRTGQVTVITGRSCPYCMRVGRIPKRSDIG